VRPSEIQAQALFRVGVTETRVAPHSRKLILSGRTEADRKIMVTTRTNGVLTELNVRRGQKVEKGDIIAVLSDEAREAQVANAEALYQQRKAEYEARSKLVEKGTLPQLNLVQLEASLRAAQAAVASAKADLERGTVRAPWSGVITEVPSEVGGSAFSMAGKEIAQIVALDPMLAVVEVSERNLAGIHVGERADVRLVTGETASGQIRFVSKSASPTTRTYRVEVELPNPGGEIPDGITAEVIVHLQPVMATKVPRSALTFSSAGELGVRIVDAGSTVQFVPVSLVEDQQSQMWVAGIADRMRVIVQGQDFVREGQKVIAVDAAPAKTASK
jgi:multidrug efflux system membrane fusion protein